MQILVVVANIQVRTLKTEVEKGSMETAVGHGLVDQNGIKGGIHITGGYALPIRKMYDHSHPSIHLFISLSLSSLSLSSI